MCLLFFFQLLWSAPELTEEGALYKSPIIIIIIVLVSWTPMVWSDFFNPLPITFGRLYKHQRLILQEAIDTQLTDQIRYVVDMHVHLPLIAKTDYWPNF